MRLLDNYGKQGALTEEDPRETFRFKAMCILTYGVILSDWFLLITFFIFFMLFIVAFGSAVFSSKVEKLFLEFMFQ
jgi:hypothetical protein